VDVATADDQEAATKIVDLQTTVLRTPRRELTRTIGVVSLTIARWPLQGGQLRPLKACTYTTWWDATVHWSRTRQAGRLRDNSCIEAPAQRRSTRMIKDQQWPVPRLGCGEWNTFIEGDSFGLVVATCGQSWGGSRC
jgi:hypothetical protein